MKVALEPATDADAPAIAAILTGWIDETEWMPRVHAPGSYLDFAQMLIGVAEVSVARSPDQVLGFVARQGEDIQALYLSPSARGSGIGGRLLDRVKSQTPTLALWTFQDNLGAIRFYHRHGFFEDQRTNGLGNDEKIPDLHMIWAKDAT